MSSLTLIRHATLVIELAGEVILVDPMLGARHAYAAVEGTQNPVPWPLVDLPVPAEDVVGRATAVAITHTHVDHLDELAMGLIRKAEVPVFCQPYDVAELVGRGVRDVRPIEAEVTWQGIRIVRTGGQHGTGEMAGLMGPVSGFVFSSDEQSIYVAGDTVWCREVGDVVDLHAPTMVVVNSGEARMEVGDPITMDAGDVVDVARHAPAAAVVAVHLETLNHCGLTRTALAEKVAAAGVRVAIPADGETLPLTVSTSLRT